jgi:hypothetical protein
MVSARYVVYERYGDTRNLETSTNELFYRVEVRHGSVALICLRKATAL